MDAEYAAIFTRLREQLGLPPREYAPEPEVKRQKQPLGPEYRKIFARLRAELEEPEPLVNEDPGAVAYMMGILAGEGCFYASDDGGYASIQVGMTVRHTETIRWLYRNFGGYINGPYPRKPPSHDMMFWSVRGPHLRALVPVIHRNRHLFDPHVAGRFDTMCKRTGIDRETGELLW